MAVTVIDSTDLEAVLADATGQPQPAKDTREAPDAASGKPKDGDDDAGAEPAAAGAEADDVEGEDGFTPREKRELTAKNLKAIGKRVKQLRAAEEFAAAQYSERMLADQRASKLQAELDGLRAAAPVAAKPIAEPPRPKVEDFDSQEKYQEALVDWKVDQKLAARLTEEQKQAKEEEMAQITAKAAQMIEKARELVPDFMDTIQSVGELQVPPLVGGYIQRSALFAETAYWLAKNPQVMRDLAALPPDEQLVTIGKIESRLSPFGSQDLEDDQTGDPVRTNPESVRSNGKLKDASPSAETGASPSKARIAAPVTKPLSSSGALPLEIDPSDMDIRQTISDWEKRNRVNLGRRRRH